MKEEDVIGREVTVYDRHLFAVPVRGTVTAISSIDGSYQVNFYSGNPGCPNATKHNGKYFHPQQCRIVKEDEEGEDILDGTDDRRTDPKFNHKIGFIPFAYPLVPLRGLAKVAAVMRKGERKDRNGWEEVPVEEHLNHAISHIIAYLEGRHAEHHLANAGCRVLMALDLDRREVLPCPTLDGSKPSMLDSLSKERTTSSRAVKQAEQAAWAPDWVEPRLTDEVDLAYSIKEAFDYCMARGQRKEREDGAKKQESVPSP